MDDERFVRDVFRPTGLAQQLRTQNDSLYQIREKKDHAESAEGAELSRAQGKLCSLCWLCVRHSFSGFGIIRIRQQGSRRITTRG
ncbi:MAG TPA: hypothetical protein VHG08_02390, partial [Longimicrobium sp.]|nr:hypothetical protein [Longimicrobium sp.]